MYVFKISDVQKIFVSQWYSPWNPPGSIIFILFDAFPLKDQQTWNEFVKNKNENIQRNKTLDLQKNVKTSVKIVRVSQFVIKNV